MRELDLTQKSLGQKIGVIQTQISNWINDTVTLH
jgi:plasmid maintenance system antidote protein VapI